jgi:hypothetical protein
VRRLSTEEGLMQLIVGKEKLTKEEMKMTTNSHVRGSIEATTRGKRMPRKLVESR